MIENPHTYNDSAISRVFVKKTFTTVDVVFNVIYNLLTLVNTMI